MQGITSRGLGLLLVLVTVSLNVCTADDDDLCYCSREDDVPVREEPEGDGDLLGRASEGDCFIKADDDENGYLALVWHFDDDLPTGWSPRSSWYETTIGCGNV